MSLEHRLKKSKDEVVDLLFDIAALRDKLALYEQFFPDLNKAVVVNFKTPESNDTLDLLIRYNKAEQTFELLFNHYHKPVPLQSYQLAGILETIKFMTLQESYFDDEDDEADDDEDEYDKVD